MKNLQAVSIDDEEINLLIIEKMARDTGIDIISYQNPVRALEQMKIDRPDMVFIDYMMPGLDGIAITSELRRLYPELIIVMITSAKDKDIKLRAIKAGATEFLNKPLDPSEFSARVATLEKLIQSQRLLENRALLLQVEVQKAVSEILNRELEAIEVLGKAADYRDELTGSHVRRVAGYSRLLGELYGLESSKLEILFHSSTLHDIGKVGISDTILLKKGSLAEEEFEIVKKHSEIGYGILKNSMSPYLKSGAEISISHHEKYDSSGYPRGLKGNDIPLFGRITAIADTLDVITTERPYKKAMPFEEAEKIINLESGRHFDPDLVKLFAENITGFRNIYSEFMPEQQYEESPAESHERTKGKIR